MDMRVEGFCMLIHECLCRWGVCVYVCGGTSECVLYACVVVNVRVMYVPHMNACYV